MNVKRSLQFQQIKTSLRRDQIDDSEVEIDFAFKLSPTKDTRNCSGAKALIEKCKIFTRFGSFYFPIGPGDFYRKIRGANPDGLSNKPLARFKAWKMGGEKYQTRLAQYIILLKRRFENAP